MDRLRSLLGHVDGYRDVSGPSNNNNASGCSDIVIPFNGNGRVVIEFVMHSRGRRSQDAVIDHAMRFLEKGAYRAGDQKGLVIIGRSPPLCETKHAGATAETLRETMQKAREALDETNADHGVEIIGVLVAPDHTRYSMYVLPATLGDAVNHKRPIFGPIELPCDMVSRRVVWDGDEVIAQPAQRYASIKLDHSTEVWVTDGAVSFPVTPSKPTVMHLKDAIKAERAVRYAHIDANRIIIKLPDGSKPGDKDPLRGNVEYVFVVPK